MKHLSALLTAVVFLNACSGGYLDRPYRQRAYRLNEEEGHQGSLYRSAVYTLSAPSRFAGAWDCIAVFEALSPDSLVEHSGCDILLSLQEDGSFAGKTGEKSCASSLRGAVYATSVVTMNSTQLVRWDQGWDADGQQVWGAEKGGYIFKRVSAAEAARELSVE